MHTFNSPLEAFLHWEATTPNRVFLNQPINRKIISYTFAEAGEQARKVAGRLKSYNLPKRSHVALISNNCAHWIMSDIAIMMADCVSIPIYPSLNAESVNQVLVHSESKAVIIGKLDNFEKQKSGIPDIHRISVGLYGNNEGDLWEDIVLNEEKLEQVHIQKPDDLHTIIYTSGTTGTPKGVMHSVNNFNGAMSIAIELFSIEKHSRLFSYLPLAHVAERLATRFPAVTPG